MIARDFDMSKIQRGEDGKVQNRAELLEAIKSNYPDCVSEITIDGTPKASPPIGNDKPITRDQLKTMTPDQINANWAAVKAGLGIK